MKPMRPLWMLVLLLTIAAPVAARVGDPLAAFSGGPLIFQLQLNPQGQMALTGARAGRTLHRFVSDDRTITVDLVVWGGAIEEEIMYLPVDMRRGVQVSWFLQDALGSVVGAQQGLLAFRAAVINGSNTAMPFGTYTMRFTHMGRDLLQVIVSR